MSKLEKVALYVLVELAAIGALLLIAFVSEATGHWHLLGLTVIAMPFVVTFISLVIDSKSKKSR